MLQLGKIKAHLFYKCEFIFLLHYFFMFFVDTSPFVMANLSNGLVILFVVIIYVGVYWRYIRN